MSSLPTAELRPAPVSPAARHSRQWAAFFAALLTVLGVIVIWPTVHYLWALWTTDPLKSIGMFIPAVSLLLILRAWRSLGWEMRGTWWGLVILVGTAAAVYFRERSVLVLVLSPQWSIFFPPHSLVAVLYATGAVLLFGGKRLLRAALFPVLLLWFVNPIPHVFNVFVDLPLQRVSAHVARGFAIALGQKLSPDQLRLMFTPDFGMFIAPGCNGIRGAVTMGFIALVAGYIYRFRWYAHALIVTAAILLGYVFNFVRLCTLVLYYIVALHLPWLQSRAEMGDYIIGGCLFLVATFLLFYAIQKLRTDPALSRKETSEPRPLPASTSFSLYSRLLAMLLLVIAGAIPVSAALLHRSSAAQQTAPSASFPQRLGDYTLARSWDETLVTGTLIFHWADYAPVGGGTHVAIGISPVLGTHDTLICHSARGEDPIWRGELDLPTASGEAVPFSGSFFNDGATQYVEATTICNGSSCGEFTGERRHFGLVYSRPAPESIFSDSPARPIPILIRAETLDTNLPADFARQQMTAAVTHFVHGLNLDSLIRPYRIPPKG